MTDAARRGVFMRMFSSALASQVLLSAASFMVGLLLIRHANDVQYGYYILVSSALILAVSLQNSFIAPAMINRMTHLGRSECGDLTGGLYREQKQVIVAVAAVAAAITATLGILRLLDQLTVWLMLSAIATMIATLRREYFRMVLLAYRRSHEVLLGDSVYAGVLLIGVALAIVSPAPATAAVLASGVAALISGWVLSRDLRKSEEWNARGAPGILRDIAPLGAWSTAGAAVHWSFSQGYTYMVASTLDVRAIAAVAATRLLVMPVNLLSSGIGSLMLPITSRWLHEMGPSLVMRRLFWLALGVACMSVCYFGVLWVLRDWIFDIVLKKQFAQRDVLLQLWAGSFVLMAVHQQLIYMLVARERFHMLTSLGLVSAVAGLSSSYWGILHYGGAGAPLGILVGEFINTAGIAVLCLREAAPSGHHRAAQAATSP